MKSTDFPVLDSRRITGAHLVLEAAGALIDVTGPPDLLPRAIEGWRREAGAILEALGWPDAKLGERRVPRGASLGFTAPIDALYSSTEVNEWAWGAAVADCCGESFEPLAEAANRLSKTIAEERNPRLTTLASRARARQIPCVSDDDEVSLGLGAHSRTWPVAELPGESESEADEFWRALGEIPVLVVTGTNGKTTTIRLLASIARAGGVVAGFTSTDGFYVHGERIASGDYSGPGGARMVVRDRRVELALLETARGGLLRRGLPLEQASAVAVTNVAADHLGEFGVHDVEAIAETKWTVSRLVSGEHGALVLNADDPRLLARGVPLGSQVTWVTLNGEHPEVLRHLKAGGSAATLVRGSGGGELTLWSGTEARTIARAEELPITFGGAAHYNVANALTAAALADRAGISIEAIREGLLAFEPTPENSPGRGNWFEVSGVRIYVDFAHNPHGFEAMVAMVSRIPHERLGLVLGQAGDRDEASIRELTAIACRLDPARIVIKEMPEYLRGRKPGVNPAWIEDELVQRGIPLDRISHAETEGAAVSVLREWSQPGDLLILPLHAERDAVIASLRSPGS